MPVTAHTASTAPYFLSIGFAITSDVYKVVHNIICAYFDFDSVSILDGGDLPQQTRVIPFTAFTLYTFPVG